MHILGAGLDNENNWSTAIYAWQCSHTWLACHATAAVATMYSFDVVMIYIL